MTLATHIVVASALTKPLVATYPLIATLIALASHYVFDSIPHWDYKLNSISVLEKTGNNAPERRWVYSKIFGDLTKITLDFLIGLGVTLLFVGIPTNETFIPFLIVVFSSVIPDFLQGAFFTGKFPFLYPFQKIHDFCHSKIKLNPYPLIGVPSQLFIFLVFIYFLS